MSESHYGQKLRYPERAEVLSPRRHPNYRVDLTHWAALANVFRDAYQTVYARGMSRVLLVHGAQGSGKSLFCRRLEEGFHETSEALNSQRSWSVNREENLWHLLVHDPADRDAPAERSTLTDVTRGSRVYRVSVAIGWLGELRTRASTDGAQVRVLIFDNFHDATFLSELSGATLDYCYQQQREGREDTLYQGAAQRLVHLARNELVGSIFVCLSNQRGAMEGLLDAIRREHVELARLQEVPLPKPPNKERIVRSNLNRLNSISYWGCLDRALPTGRASVREALCGSEGIGRVYEQVDTAMESRRVGAPARRNLLTIVTLGMDPSEVTSFLGTLWDKPEEAVHISSVLGVWRFSDGFAYALARYSVDTDDRPLRLLDSEFMVRWIALGAQATRALVGVTTPQDGDDGDVLLSAILAKDDSADDWSALSGRLGGSGDSTEWFANFRALVGNARSAQYESVLDARSKARGLKYSAGMPNYSSVKPDITVSPYPICALTAATSNDEIPNVMRRDGHVIEFTSHPRSDESTLSRYLLGKVIGYANMLEAL